MPAHQLLKSPHRRAGPAVVSSSTVPSIESIYALVGKPTPSPPSTYSPADITAKRKEEYRRKQEKDEEGLGTASAFSSGNLDAYGQGIISGHSSGINIKARAKAFGEGRSSPKVERSPTEQDKQQQQQQKQQRSPEMQLPRSVAEKSSHMPSIGILPGGGNSDYPAVYSGTPASQKRHYNQYDEEVLEEKSAFSDSNGVNRERYGLSADTDSISKEFSSPIARRITKDETSPTATSPSSNVTPSRISASKRAEDARKEYVRELEAQVSEQRKRKEAEKAYRMSPGWTGQNSNTSNFSQNAIMSPSNGGIAELLGSSNGYFSVDSRSPGVGPSNNKSPHVQHHQQQYSSSSSSSMNSSPRPFLRLDPLPEGGGGGGEGIIPSNSAVEGPWTPRSPQRQSSLVTEGGGRGVHSYSPTWLAQQAAELEADASIGRGGGGGNGGGRMATTNVIGIKSPGGQSSTSTATTRDRLLREQVNRLTEKFDITLDALQQYADRFGPLD